MNDKELLYIISTGAVLPEILAKELEISLFEAESIFTKLENDGLIEKEEIHIPILNNPNAYKIRYLVTEAGIEYADLD